MAEFDSGKFISMLRQSPAFTAVQIEALAGALETSLKSEPVVPGESLDAPPLRGTAADLS